MDIVVRAFGATLEVAQSIDQMEGLFGEDLAKRGLTAPPFANIERLHFRPRAEHPILGWPDKLRRSFDKPTGTYYIDAIIDYVAWVSPESESRIDSFARAISAAVALIPNSRVSQGEKETLLGLVEATRQDLRRRALDRLTPVGPIYLDTNENGETSIGFAKECLVSTGRTVEVAPQEAAKYISNWVAKPDAPPLFKLYKKAGKDLLYREGWFSGDRVFEHWGTCGERGSVREHGALGLHDAARILNRLKSSARQEGFKSRSKSQMTTLVVEYPIERFGTSTDLKTRHMIEDRLNELVGWLGLGHLDGGSTGSGSMDVFLIVVDFEVAKTAIELAAKGTDLDGFSRIYCMK
jgi:hypothetical protein